MGTSCRLVLTHPLLLCCVLYTVALTLPGFEALDRGRYSLCHAQVHGIQPGAYILSVSDGSLLIRWSSFGV